MRQTIKRIWKSGFILLAGVIAASNATAAALDMPEAPYREIVKRNLFRLRAIAPAISETPATPSIPLPKITLTGITTILGKKIAFITIAASKPGQLPDALMLAEGQRANGIEVKNIDEQAGIVRITNQGEPQILDFDHDGVKFSNPSPANIPVNEIPPPRPPLARSEIPLSQEGQAALIEIQRAKFRQENNPIQNILPPTEMSSEAAGDGPADPNRN